MQDDNGDDDGRHRWAAALSALDVCTSSSSWSRRTKGTDDTHGRGDGEEGHHQGRTDGRLGGGDNVGECGGGGYNVFSCSIRAFYICVGRTDARL